MVTGKDRVELAAACEPVSICNIKVIPGDIVCGDASGIVVVPSGRAAEVLEQAKRVDAAEGAIEEEIKKGLSLIEARQRFRYEELNRPPGGDSNEK
jgi:regulator of RNase E activity RraA